MKELVVLSGKGGTGKTSVVASFAKLAEQSLVLGDCDVDAANLALLLPGEDQRKEPFFAGQKARIQIGRCTQCGECVETCRYGAIQEEGSGMRVDPFFCEGCRACSLVCPEDAITFVENRCGTIYERITSEGPLVHAELGIAQDNSGKLVTRVRQKTRFLAEEHQADLILLDGPPGIGCPVHASVGGASLVVLVTEPTPSGIHDLIRILDLCQHFNLKSLVVVNKLDINKSLSDKVLQVAKQKDAIPIGGIPFHPDVPRALARGELPIAIPEIRRAVVPIWKQIGKFLF